MYFGGQLAIVDNFMLLNLESKLQLLLWPHLSGIPLGAADCPDRSRKYYMPGLLVGDWQ